MSFGFGFTTNHFEIHNNRFDKTVDDSISRMADQKRTCDLILAVGDGNLGEVRGMQYSDSVVNVFDDRNMRPTNATWHFLIPQMIYWGMV